MNSCSLQAQDVGFHYGRNRAHPVLDGFSWAVPSGQTTLLLGPNGAGKSTLLKLLCGFERPTRGQISVNGRTDRDALYESVGWMPQDVQPARGLTVAEQVEYAAWVAGASHRDARFRASEALDAVDLSDKAEARVDRISGGQLRRVGLAQALVRQSPVLLLDEPTAGLDPAQALNFRRILATLDRPGGIVISTHQVADLEDDVDRVAVLDRGSLRFEGTVAEFRGLGSEVGGDRPVSLASVFASMIGGGGKH